MPSRFRQRLRHLRDPKRVQAWLTHRLFLVRMRFGKRRPYPNDYSYQTPWMRRLPASGHILDIASGHNPFPRATILSDRFLQTTVHRRDELVRDSRPFLLLDIEHLPFKDKSIAYVYCSHVLEHTANPEVACQELARVAKAGFIETPTLMKDALFAWAADLAHRWHVVRSSDRLFFFEYDARTQHGVRSRIWRDYVQSPLYHPLQDIFFQNLDIFNTHLEWEGRIPVTVVRLDAESPA